MLLLFVTIVKAIWKSIVVAYCSALIVFVSWKARCRWHGTESTYLLFDPWQNGLCSYSSRHTGMVWIGTDYATPTNNTNLYIIDIKDRTTTVT